MRSFAAYIFMLFFMLLYTYYLGGENSMLMLYMLFLSPLVSFFLTYPLRKKINVSIDVPSSEVEKEGTVKVTVTITNKTLIPVLYIGVSFMKAQNLQLQGFSDIKISLAPHEKRTVVARYNAMHRGVCEIGVKDIFLQDYLGFFSFSLLKGFEEYEKKGKVTVLPRIINIKMNSKIAQSSSRTNSTDNSSGSSTGFFNWSGEPGYELKEYEAGDPLHKIHWKLSAKTDKFMVRMNDSGGVSKKRLIVDPLNVFRSRNRNLDVIKKKSLLARFFKKSVKPGDEDWIIEERILEAVLSVTDLMNRWGRTVEVWLFEDNQWQMHKVAEKKDIIQLQHRLAGYSFIGACPPTSERVPLTGIMSSEGKNRNSNAGEVLIFSGCPDKTFQKSIESLSDYGMATDVVVVKKPLRNLQKHSNADIELKVPEEGSLWVIKTDDNLEEALL